MHLFSKQMMYDKEMVSKLEQICLFNALVYTKHWLESPNGVDAPFNDLQLIKELKDFKDINKEVSVKASNILENHYWYLTEELAVFALFSNKVDLLQSVVSHRKKKPNLKKSSMTKIKDFKAL